MLISAYFKLVVAYKYGFGENGAMTRLVGTFAAGYGIILLIALLTTIKGGWLLFTYGFIQAVIGAVVCYRTINSEWGIIEGLASPEGYIAPGVIAVLNLVVLIQVKNCYSCELILHSCFLPFVTPITMQTNEVKQFNWLYQVIKEKWCG